MELIFFSRELLSWETEELTDDCQLFDVVETQGVILGQLVDMFALSYPDRVRIFPDQT